MSWEKLLLWNVADPAGPSEPLGPFYSWQFPFPSSFSPLPVFFPEWGSRSPPTVSRPELGRNFVGPFGLGSSSVAVLESTQNGAPLQSAAASGHGHTLMKVKWLSRIWLFANPWTITCQAPLSMRFSRQEFGVGCHFLLQGIFPAQGSNPGLQHCRQALYRLSHQGISEEPDTYG